MMGTVGTAGMGRGLVRMGGGGTIRMEILGVIRLL